MAAVINLVGPVRAGLDLAVCIMVRRGVRVCELSRVTL